MGGFVSLMEQDSKISKKKHQKICQVKKKALPLCRFRNSAIIAKKVNG